MKESVAHGASDTTQTKGMITSLWFISENIAGYIGSALGGITYDTMGFENSTLIVIGLQGMALLAIGFLYCINGRSQATEKEALLPVAANKKLFSKNKKEDKNANYCTMVV